MTATLSLWFLLACSTSPPPSAAHDLDWLRGTWRVESGPLVTEERWSATPDGQLLGAGRVLRNDQLSFYETLDITYSTSGALTYTAWPVSQDPVVFDVSERSEQAITFTNPAHDFPQQITYTRADATTLNVKAVGTSSAGPRTESWSLELLPGSR
jgi:hypothetical protein